jgi:TnpA family transposase
MPTHGPSLDFVHITTLIGFGITRLLNFDLIARFKQINVMKLYLPGKGDRFAYPLLRPALTRPVRPELIENNYDMMIRYATAIRQGTASTEALLRRFQGETTHPALLGDAGGRLRPKNDFSGALAPRSRSAA